MAIDEEEYSVTFRPIVIDFQWQLMALLVLIGID